MDGELVDVDLGTFTECTLYSSFVQANVMVQLRGGLFRLATNKANQIFVHDDFADLWNFRVQFHVV